MNTFQIINFFLRSTIDVSTLFETTVSPASSSASASSDDISIKVDDTKNTFDDDKKPSLKRKSSTTERQIKYSRVSIKDAITTNSSYDICTKGNNDLKSYDNEDEYLFVSTNIDKTINYDDDDDDDDKNNNNEDIIDTGLNLKKCHI